MATDFVPTRASALKFKAAEEFQTTNHKNYQPKSTQQKLQVKNKDKSTVVEPEIFNIKRARHEVIRFGMSGFSGQEKEDARVALAIKLGAKPDRAKYINYKDLKLKRAAEKEEKQNISEFQQLGKNAHGLSTAKGKSFNRKRKNEMRNMNILDIYGTLQKNDVEAKTSKTSKFRKRK